MPNNQTIKVICKGCGDILDEPSNLSKEKRKTGSSRISVITDG